MVNNYILDAAKLEVFIESYDNIVSPIDYIKEVLN